MGCGWWNPPTPYKEDCYWYREEQDMNAHISYCTCKNEFPLNSCENCEDYHGRHQRTQGDRIRWMNDRQLAELFIDVVKKSAEKLCESLKTVDVNLSDCDFNARTEELLEWLREEVK